MLQVTADVFSGRPNPVWIISDEREARATLREIVQERSLVTEGVTEEAGLGFRGLIVEPLTDELSHDFDVPASFYIPAGVSGSASATGKGNEIAQRLISQLSGAPAGLSVGAEALPLNDTLQQFLLDQLEFGARHSVLDSSSETAAEVEGAGGETGDQEGAAEEAAPAVAVSCQIELAPYNPGFWNNDPTTLRNNNCYNYASNKKTNTFAQPGRGAGQIYTAITCPAVTAAALRDGLHHRFNCFPPQQAPRYLVAMVVAPGPGFVDYHWYRKMKEGFWGHKPGSTPVRNVDNSNRVISDPATCNRGPYTQFCGYFYTCKDQKIR